MIELIGFALLAGLISRLLIHYLDHSENEILVPTLIVAMVGVVAGGFLPIIFFKLGS